MPANDKYLVIGLGGIGSEAAPALSTRVAAEFGEGAVRSLTLDVNHDSPELPREILRARDISSDLFFDSNSLKQSLEQGFKGRPRIGALLSLFPTQQGQNFAQQVEKLSVDLLRNGGNLTVVTVASLVGGTGSGAITILPKLLKARLLEKGIPTRFLGFGAIPALSSSIIGLRNKQSAASVYNELRQLSTTEGTNSYDEFYIGDLNASILERPKLVDQIATAAMTVLRGSKTDQKPTSDQSLLFALVADKRRVDAELLWTSGLQCVGQDATAPLVNLCFSVPRLPGHLGAALEEFRYLVAKPDVREQELQSFLERNSEFLLGVDYDRAVPQVLLREEQRTTLKPDFMLVPSTRMYADMLELKLPGEPLSAKKGTHVRFSAAVTKALAQLRAYHDFFDERHNRDQFLIDHGFTAYKPKLTLVIGRWNDQTLPESDFRRLAADQKQCTIWTYDDLLDRAERLIHHAARQHR